MTVLATQPQFWIIPIVIAALLALATLWAFGFERWFGDGYGGWSATGVGLAAIAVILGIVYALLLMPYDSKYHVFYRLSGPLTVETNTFTAGDGEISRSSVGYVDGYPDPIVLNSSRLMALDGADVDLTCTIAWEPYGLDTTYCELAAIR